MGAGPEGFPTDDDPAATRLSIVLEGRVAGLIQFGEEADHGGWPMILSGLEDVLETGDLLTTPGSLRYS